MSCYIKIWAKGNPGNIMMMYLSALKLKSSIPDSTILNVDIPIFNIHIPSMELPGLGLHNKLITNSKQFGYVPVRGLSHAVNITNANFVSLEGFCQHIDNFPKHNEIDYDKMFPPLNDENGGTEDDIVINIRGGEILEGIHPHYCLIPPEFYSYVISQTNKSPIFYGQLDDSPYMQELRARFPTARFIGSRGVKEDFDFIRKSKHIIPCLSTFSWMASWLSKATTIHLPIAGILNPMQHRSSMLVPLQDPRYHFYLFPNFYAKHVNYYKDYIDPVRENWEPIDRETLSKILKFNVNHIDDFICSLDIDDYLTMYPDERNDFNQFGSVGIFNNYMNNGFFQEKYPIRLDTGFYTSKYPQVGKDISWRRYNSAEEHYILKGRYMGLQKREDIF